MKIPLTLAAMAVGALPTAAFAQSMQSMPGMSTPMPEKLAKTSNATAAKAKPKKGAARHHTAPKGVAHRHATRPARRGSSASMPGMSMPRHPSTAPFADMRGMAMPAEQHSPAAAPTSGMTMPTPAPDGAVSGASHGEPSAMSAMPGMTHPGDQQQPMTNMPGMSDSPPSADHGAMPGMGSTAYAQGSGTSRVPGGEGAMHGLHLATGAWMVMLHGYVWGTYTDQGGPRGANEAYVQSMAMLQADHDLGGARLQLRSMLSLDPLMGPRGYPNLFATGETADGAHPLIDRQHPHDLFMELSGRIDVDVALQTSVFVYGGPVAEPALGPSAFMHRASASYLPDSPITHHWFDSTHISYGVVTAGLSTPHWQIEGSAFRGREPDQHRWDIETPKLDSWSVRTTWTPSPDWAVQLSHGFIMSGEQLEPGIDEHRTTASVSYTHAGLSATAGFAIKDKSPGRTLTAFLVEANYEIGAHHTVFGRFENVANDELFPDQVDPLHDQSVRVSKLEGGYAYRIPLGSALQVALGGSVAAYAKPAALDAAYGTFPISFSLFAKVSLGH